ncbi:MAG: carboxypeptidase-like regulatory domain-containing protein, partial [Acidobacteriota bacterium]
MSYAKVAMLCLLVPGLYAQGLTGSITGNVTDQTGAAVPAAEVLLTNTANGQTRTAQPDANGDFVFTQLLPSTYKVSVSAKGFRRYEQSDIILTATERVVLKRVELQLGELTQTVEVTAETARLQTQSAERSGLISLDQTQNVPLKGRDYLG